MTRSLTILAILAATTLSSSVSATFCLFDHDCSVPDIWSLVGCKSGSCVKTGCKSGCASTGSGCAPTTQVQSCPSGQAWNPLSKACINILTDVNHCGGFENSCGSDPLASIFCSNGSCQKTCHSSCYKDDSGTCVPSLPSACGSSGKSCPSPSAHGQASCNNGVCGISCDSGFVQSGNDCILQNTPSSCGLLNINCPTYGSGTSATCTNGICGVSCSNGGVFNHLTKSCTSASNFCGISILGKSCPSVANGRTYCDGLSCEVACNDGYVPASDGHSLLGGLLDGHLLDRRTLSFGSSTTTCVPAGDNDNFCGLSGKTCSTSLPNCVSKCCGGSCLISGAPGYTYSSSAGACVPTTTTTDCGSLGFTCYAPPNATPSCKTLGGLLPICSYTCNPGYTKFLLSCVPIQASYRAKTKRHTKAAVGFCPDNEEACPIVGSNSLKQALANASSSGSAVSSGYECLDTKTSLESCGGCASTGAGTDCTRIAKAKSMGCDAGQCVVFECERGFRPNDTMTGCERVPSKEHKRLFSHKASRAHSFHNNLSL